MTDRGTYMGREIEAEDILIPYKGGELLIEVYHDGRMRVWGPDGRLDDDDYAKIILHLSQQLEALDA